MSLSNILQCMCLFYINAFLASDGPFKVLWDALHHIHIIFKEPVWWEEDARIVFLSFRPSTFSCHSFTGDFEIQSNLYSNTTQRKTQKWSLKITGEFVFYISQ